MGPETDRKARAGRMELWAGVECTLNRVGEAFFDQLDQSGHGRRIEDIELFAELGVRTLRYPVLWERLARDRITVSDWSWADQRIERLRALGIRPIVGLVHHGSGPRPTSLVDPGFAEALARYAGGFAERYPWVEDYTPINEPLTTARFSGLYGLWYPHARDELSFARALLGQCRAVVLAMRAIRRVNPAARLVQTEDLGRIFSTRALSYQAEFENHRRWLTFDLLCGRLGPGAPLWEHLRWLGVTDEELRFFQEDPCPPDILGINYYLTSDRFLDPRLGRYPRHLHGGNGRHHYADVEAVRVRAKGIAGHRAILGEAWERYRRPLAITEVHLGCSREEQLRWLWEAWQGADAARRAGADVRAVTAWALLGAYDWDSLVTRSGHHYEPGVFDVRAPRPRATALAAMVRSLAGGGGHEHRVLAVLATAGWWRRPGRMIYPAVGTSPPARSPGGQRRAASLRPGAGEAKGRPLLVTGATGTLGRAFARICAQRGLACHPLSRGDLDIADPAAVDSVLEGLRPWAVVNAAGYVRVDDAEREPSACRRDNTTGPAILAGACSRQKVALLTFSSDLVFDGRKAAPYVESDEVVPLSVYGTSKAEAERRVLDAWPAALVVRTAAFFSPWDEGNFVTRVLGALRSGRSFRAAVDAVVSPTYVPDLAHASLDLLIDGERGVWHLANLGALSWAELARQAADLAGLDSRMVEGCETAGLCLPAPRPAYTALGSERGALLPPLLSSLQRYLAEAEPPPAQAGAA